MALPIRGECGPRVSRVRVVSALVLLVVGVLCASCTNAPPPPLVTSAPHTTTPAIRPSSAEVVFGIDTVAGGFNPHTLADQSSLTTALSSVVLPSVFRPGPAGLPELDTALVHSAEVTGELPFTVTYDVRADASWSDGAPIAAEDFVYLSDQMRTQPGVINAAGYRLISSIASRAGGKHVEVTFSRPYPGWRTLFDNLLPAHLLRDAPGGWQSALADNFPAAGGQFAIRTLDRDRGEVVLERNDRYWDKPAVLDRVVLRKSDSSGLATALASNSNQAALLRADSIALNELRALGSAVTLSTVPRATVAQVLLRPGSPQLADVRVRTALAAALDRESLIGAGAASGPSAQLRADAQVRAPAQTGYAATMPVGAPGARQDPAAAQAMLTAAGYQRGATGWTKDGKPVSLVIAAPGGTDPYVSIANRVREQLVEIGMAATVITPAPATLYGELLTMPTAGKTPKAVSPQVDIVVGPRAVTADSAADLASAFGCQQPLPATTLQPPANAAGFCDSAVQTTIDGALTGLIPVDQAIAAVEPVLWQQAVAIPLFQLADVLAARPDVRGLAPGAPFVGPLSGAATWRRVA